jgi:ribosomal RNA-processing protein 8
MGKKNRDKKQGNGGGQKSHQQSGPAAKSTSVVHKHKSKSSSPNTSSSSNQPGLKQQGGKGGGKVSGLSALQQKFAKKLEGSRFRIINEKLYTTVGSEALDDFTKNPTLFDVYHEGFREQASHWPENPLDGIINWIKSKHPKSVVADMGCGDARLQASVPNKVHSFDLVSRNSAVTACDIANCPLPDASVDIVVFCLALMGTNIADFLREARRILKVGGVIRIAEVRSRFEGEKEGVRKFLGVMKKCGFDLVQKDKQQQQQQGGGSTSNSSNTNNDKNKMFFEVEARKTTREPEQALSFSAKACIYKRR